MNEINSVLKLYTKTKEIKIENIVNDSPEDIEAIEIEMRQFIEDPGKVENGIESIPYLFDNIDNIIDENILESLFNITTMYLGKEELFSTLENETKAKLVSTILCILQKIPRMATRLFNGVHLPVLINFFREFSDVLGLFNFSIIVLKVELSHKYANYIFPHIESLILSEDREIKCNATYIAALMLRKVQTLHIEVKRETKLQIIQQVLEETDSEIFSPSLLMLAYMNGFNADANEEFFSTELFNAISERFMSELVEINIVALCKIVKISPNIIMNFVNSDLFTLLKREISNQPSFVIDVFIEILTVFIDSNEMILVLEAVNSEEFSEIYRLVFTSGNGRFDYVLRLLLMSLERFVQTDIGKTYDLSNTFIFADWFKEIVYSTSEDSYKHIKYCLENPDE